MPIEDNAKMPSSLTIDLNGFLRKDYDVRFTSPIRTVLRSSVSVDCVENHIIAASAYVQLHGDVACTVRSLQQLRRAHLTRVFDRLVYSVRCSSVRQRAASTCRIV